jgi:hypothetical protein
MRVKLDDRFVRMLLAWPESGMGYQRVDLRLADGRELRDVCVFNAEEAELPEAVADVSITDMQLHTR